MMRSFKYSLILGICGFILLVFYQNADRFDGTKPLVFPRYFASIHKDQMAARNQQMNPETYLKEVYDRSPASATLGSIGRILTDEPPPSECNLNDPTKKCSDNQNSENKESEIGVGMDPMQQQASVRLGSTFETTMKSWDKDPVWVIRQDLSPNSCLNVEMNSSGNQGRVLFDLKF